MYVVTLWRFRLSASTPYWLVGCFSPLTSWSWWTTNEPKVHWATTSWIHNSSDPNIFTHFFLSVRFISNEENINPTQLDVRAYCSLISKCFVFLFLNHLISAYGNQHLKKTSAAIVDVNIVRKRKTRKAHNKKKGKKKKRLQCEMQTSAPHTVWTFFNGYSECLGHVSPPSSSSNTMIWLLVWSFSSHQRFLTSLSFFFCFFCDQLFLWWNDYLIEFWFHLCQ